MTASAVVRADFVGNDSFSVASMDTNAWSVVQAQGGASFSQTGDGVLHYTVGTATSSDATAWAWINGSAPNPSVAPYGSDWSVRLDVSNPVILTSGSAQYTNVGLSIRDAADLNNNGYSVRLDTTYASLTGHQVTSWESDKENSGGTIIQSFGTNVTSGAVLITWSASTHTLTAAFDENGASGNYVWTSFSTYDPTAGDAWNMVSGDSFVITLTGSSINTDGSNSTNFGQLYVDNFDITNSAATISSVAIPEPADSAFTGDVAVLIFALMGIRRRARLGGA